MKRRILAVDDELHMLKLIEQVISERTPHHITTTNNSLDVPGILDQEHFSVILTDLRMPGMDGLDILRWVRDNQRSEEVIIMTAFGSPDTSREALHLGAFDYLTKPIHREELLVTIDRALQVRGIKKELESWHNMCGGQPWEQAVAAFRREYFTQLGGECEWDRAAMAERSGISRDEVDRIVEDLERGEL
jgi:DNA-binding NtrC family response regulator